jgi:hypothetical protein
MARARSLSYAPDSIIPARMAPSRRPDWTLCRNMDELPVPDNTSLRRWAEQGRIRPDDYLINHQLDVCVRACDVAELDAVFRRPTARLLSRTCRGLAAASLLLLVVVPELAIVMLVSAIAAAIALVRSSGHHAACRLSAPGEHSAKLRAAGAGTGHDSLAIESAA